MGELRLIILTIVVLMVGACKFNLVDSVKANMDDHPSRQELVSNNPFNDIVPLYDDENSLGFYSGKTMYRQPALVLPGQLPHTNCGAYILHDQQDTVFYIYSSVAPYPDSFYGTLDKYDRFFNYIHFTIHPLDYVKGDPIVLNGDQVKLIDQKGDYYNVISARILLDDTLTENYVSGSFDVTYERASYLKGELTGGRFKMISGDLSLVINDF